MTISEREKAGLAPDREKAMREYVRKNHGTGPDHLHWMLGVAERMEAALADAKARALEDAAEAWERHWGRDDGDTMCSKWLRARAADHGPARETARALLDAERTRREAAEARYDDAAIAVREAVEAANARTAEREATIAALRERAEKAEARAEGLAALKLGEQLDAQRKETIAVRDRLATAERERDEAVARAQEVLAEHAEGQLRLAAELRRELDEARAEAEGAHGLFPPLLQGVCDALKGLPPEGVMYDWSDLPKVAAAVVASRDAALAALAGVTAVGRDVADGAKGCDAARSSPCGACRWCELIRLTRPGTDPAALGAKVLEEAREEGARAMREAAVAELRALEAAHDEAARASARRGVYPSDMSDSDKRAAVERTAEVVGYIDPATVCRAARGGG